MTLQNYKLHRRATCYFVTPEQVAFDEHCPDLDLLDSIWLRGVLTPILIRGKNDGSGFEVIDGHKRVQCVHTINQITSEGMGLYARLLHDRTDISELRSILHKRRSRGGPKATRLVIRVSCRELPHDKKDPTELNFHRAPP